MMQQKTKVQIEDAKIDEKRSFDETSLPLIAVEVSI
jgi:hypothetical protein